MRAWKDTSLFLNSCAHLFLRNCHGPISFLAMSMLIFLFFCLAQYFFLSHNIPLILEFSVTQVTEIKFPFFITKKKIPHLWMMLDIHFGLLVIILSQLTSSSVMQRKRNQEAQCSFKDSEPNYLVPRNRWINLRWKKKKKTKHPDALWRLSPCWFLSQRSGSLFMMERVANESVLEQPSHCVTSNAIWS